MDIIKYYSLSYDPPSWGFNTAGTHDIGYTNYFFGSSGLAVDDQNLYDASNPERIKGTISQPETPTFGLREFKSFIVDMTFTSLAIT